jgi:hypothetical protein
VRHGEVQGGTVRTPRRTPSGRDLNGHGPQRLLESIESRIDHERVAPRVRQLQTERSRLEATLGTHNQRRLSAREIAEWADSLGRVVQVLKQANPEDRAVLYAEFGLTLRYDPTKHQVKATAELSGVGRGVGGPTRNLGPRLFGQ